MCLVISDSLRGRSLHAMLKYEGPASIVKLFFTLSSFPCLLHSFRLYIRDTLGRARNLLHPGAFNVPSQDGLRTNHTNFLNTDSLCCDFFVHLRGYFQANAPFGQSLVVAVFVVEVPMASKVRQWKPFWIPVGESFTKSLLGGVEFRGRRRFRRTKSYGFPWGTTQHWPH